MKGAPHETLQNPSRINRVFRRPAWQGDNGNHPHVPVCLLGVCLMNAVKAWETLIRLHAHRLGVNVTIEIKEKENPNGRKDK